jgi:hypothetical protein
MRPPLRASQNLYAGLNAHLQSELLARGAWAGYHGALIAALAGTINRALPPGYIALSEESIQMRRPDLHIQQTPDWVGGGAPVLPSPFQPDARVLEISPDLLRLGQDEAEETLTALGIYVDAPENGVEPGERLLTWIELLSPSNKAGDKLARYCAKRDDLLAQGVTFLEIDLIHGISTSLARVADYAQPGDEAARHPYAIWFIDPRRLPDGRQFTALAQFDVNEAIPSLRIRLEENDTVLIDLGAAYAQMFAANPGWGRQVDYARPPKDIASYAQFRDLVMIAAVMIEVERLADAGVNLDHPACAPLALPSELLAALNRDPARVAAILGLSPSAAWQPSARYA